MTYPVRILHVSINQPAKEVYQFASNPENFPKWVQFVNDDAVAVMSGPPCFAHA